MIDNHKRLTVRIKKCSGGMAWYSNCIGMDYQVVDNYGDIYTVASDYEKGGGGTHRHILKDDALTIEIDNG